VGCHGIWASPLPQAGGAGGGPEMAEGVPRRGAENAEGMTEEEAEAGMAQMSKVYDGAEGAQAPDANE
jgi:hypothetical protein